jgi:RNA-directed DNA polymerase
MLTSFDSLSFEPDRIQSGKSYIWKNPKLAPTLKRDADIVKKQFIGLQSDNDVANLLEIPVGQLLYLLYQSPKKYKSFIVKKKSGENRTIDSPCASIKILQNKVKPLIESHYRVKKPVHGFVGNGKGIISNAQQHKKKTYVLNIDLKDFFHSVNFGRVQGIFRSVPFNMGNAAATVMAQLCTYNGKLPQGASTSPVLSNLAATTLDKKLVQIAKKFHLTYTRYADDITLSSNKVFSPAIVERSELEPGLFKYKVGNTLELAIKQAGFDINHDKTRLQHKSQRQEVTGLIVNQGVNVNRKFIRNTRAMINGWRKNIVEAEKRFISTRYHVNESDIDITKLDGSIYKRAIYGNLSFIKMVKGSNHSPYLTLCKQVIDLDDTPPKFINKLKNVFEMYDVFICHASEDKEEVAKPLYDSLKKRGIKAFLDSETMCFGDNLSERINTALQQSKYVVAIISEESINKTWTMSEVHSTLGREISSGKTKLLPIMLGNSNILLDKIPLLSGKIFANYDNNIENIVDKIEKRLNTHL